MENTSRRDGRPIDEVGYYNPITKQSKFDQEKIEKGLKYGVKPTQTVSEKLNFPDFFSSQLIDENMIESNLELIGI